MPLEPNGALRGTDVFIAAAGMRTIEITTNNVPPLTTVSVVAKPASGLALIGPGTNQVAGTFEVATTSVDLDFPGPGLYFIEARALVAP